MCGQVVSINNDQMFLQQLTSPSLEMDQHAFDANCNRKFNEVEQWNSQKRQKEKVRVPAYTYGYRWSQNLAKCAPGGRSSQCEVDLWL